ncbi:6128_t:CDS:2, partial [Racocetra persica]
IKKCNQLSCNICQPVRLPDNIFNSLDWLPDPIPSKNDWNYSCGSPFVPENHILYDEVFIREKISCETPIELAYYSCRKLNINSNICYWCGYNNELAEPPESLKSKYKSLFPCCILCQNAGKEFFVCHEIKTHKKDS